jgi:hypothetical protein
MKQRIPWSRLIAEGAVIVVSILLAFAIDAWWDERADDAQETALLNGLAEDFHAASDDLQRARALHEAKSVAAAQLLSWAESESLGVVQTDQVEIAISTLFAHPTFDPPMGTLRTILGSGRLDLLRNPELVRELTRWSAVFEDLREDEENANRHLYQSLFPFLSPRLNLKDLDKTSSMQWPGEKAPTDSDSLLSSLEFQSIVFMAWSLEKNVAEGLAPAEAAIDRITRLVEGELDR